MTAPRVGPEVTISEWETQVATKLHYAICGECPAYPGHPSACEPTMCDCLCPHQDMSFNEFLDAVCAALSASSSATGEREVRQAFVEGATWATGPQSQEAVRSVEVAERLYGDR